MTPTNVLVAASLPGPRNGGSSATVQTNHPPITARTPTRSSVRRRISSAPYRDELATTPMRHKTALTSNYNGNGD